MDKGLVSVIVPLYDFGVWILRRIQNNKKYKDNSYINEVRR